MRINTKQSIHILKEEKHFCFKEIRKDNIF